MESLLLHGDCIEEMKKIPDGCIDAIITDPPYGTTACKWDSIIPFDLMWEQLNRVIKKNGAIVLFGSEPFSSALRMSNIKNYKYDWIWDKKNTGCPVVAKKRPLPIHENISVFALNKSLYYPIKTDLHIERNWKQYKNSTTIPITNPSSGKTKGKYPKTILKEFSNANRVGRLHPTQKPVALIEYLIKTYTNENETVLDFTMGSGTTAIACLNTKRNFIGIEKDDNYFKVGKDRLEKHLPTLDYTPNIIYS